MNYYYTLNPDHSVRPVNIDEWWAPSFHRIAQDTVGKCRISTVFLGLDHSFGEGPPQLFETMVFEGRSGLICERCSTWDEAIAQHARIVDQVRKDPP